MLLSRRVDSRPGSSSFRPRPTLKVPSHSLALYRGPYGIVPASPIPTQMFRSDLKEYVQSMQRSFPPHEQQDQLLYSPRAGTAAQHDQQIHAHRERITAARAVAQLGALA